MLAGMFFDALEEDATGAIGEGLKASFGVGTGQLALLNTLTVIGGLTGRLVTGYLADRRGRRYALALNLLLYTVGGLLSALAPSFGFLLVTRFIVGVGLGGEFTVGLTLLSEMVATRYRGTVAASLNIGSGGVGNFVAFGLFAVLLGPLNDALGGTSTSVRVGVSGIRDDEIALLPSVDAQGLLVERGVEELVVPAGADTNGGAPVPERRPVEAQSGRDVGRVAQASLQVVAQAEVEHQRAMDAVVVLDMPAELRHRIADRRIPDALGERGWHAGGECVEAGKRERAVFVAPFIGAIAGAVDREPGGHLMGAAERELQLVFDRQLARADAAVDLRAAGGEGVEHANRRLIAQRHGYRWFAIRTVDERR